MPKQKSMTVNEAVELLVSFVPPWAKDVPPGLSAVFYGTGTKRGDEEVVARTKEALAVLEGKRLCEETEARYFVNEWAKEECDEFSCLRNGEYCVSCLARRWLAEHGGE